MSSASNSPRLRGRLGNAATTSIEFALVLLVFLWMLFGTIDIARYLFITQSLVGLMGEAGRASIFEQFSPTCPTTWANISTVAPLLDASQVTLCIQQSGTGGGNIWVTVQVSYPFTPYTPGLSALGGTITEYTQYTY